MGLCNLAEPHPSHLKNGNSDGPLKATNKVTSEMTHSLEHRRMNVLPEYAVVVRVLLWRNLRSDPGPKLIHVPH